jgi:protocatechuate 3,4-dioxygenase beta subunit
VLARLDDVQRATLIAARVDGGYAIDFHLQGDRETAFFRI